MILEEEKCFFGNLSTSSDKYTFTRNLKVGSTKEEVIQAFYHEEKLTDYIVNDQVVGKFLYGTHLRDQLYNAKISDSYSYGSINTYASSQDESVIEYVSLKSPYLSEYASSYDAYCRIVFHFTKDVASSISWEYCPATLDTTEN